MTRRTSTPQTQPTVARPAPALRTITLRRAPESGATFPGFGWGLLFAFPAHAHQPFGFLWANLRGGVSGRKAGGNLF